MSLLSMAEPIASRLKLYLYGEAGTGKTVTSLSFPKPAVIDAERGTEHYGKYFKFARTFTSDPSDIKAVIEELLENPQGFKTFVVDPFTAVYDTIMLKHESRMKVKTGNPNYQLQPLDRQFIRNEVKGLIQKMLTLDMNVIVTARSATLYSTEEFMKVEGTKADGPKDLPYMFDTVIELTKNSEGKFIANVKKDRTNMLPSTFEFSYQALTEYLGIEGLEREPVVFNQKTALNQLKGRNTKIEINGKEITTAGINAENLEKLAALAEDFSEEKLQTKLREDYMVDSVLDLKNDEAELLIKDLSEILNG